MFSPIVYTAGSNVTPEKQSTWKKSLVFSENILVKQEMKFVM